MGLNIKLKIILLTLRKFYPFCIMDKRNK